MICIDSLWLRRHDVKPRSVEDEGRPSEDDDDGTQKWSRAVAVPSSGRRGSPSSPRSSRSKRGLWAFADTESSAWEALTQPDYCILIVLPWLFSTNIWLNISYFDATSSIHGSLVT